MAQAVVKGSAPDVGLEHFALRLEGELAVVLVNKRRQAYKATVKLPQPRGGAELFQYSTVRIADAPYPVGQLQPSGGRYEVQCPAYSVTVLHWGR